MNRRREFTSSFDLSFKSNRVPQDFLSETRMTTSMEPAAATQPCSLAASLGGDAGASGGFGRFGRLAPDSSSVVRRAWLTPPKPTYPALSSPRRAAPGRARRVRRRPYAALGSSTSSPAVGACSNPGSPPPMRPRLVGGSDTSSVCGNGARTASRNRSGVRRLNGHLVGHLVQRQRLRRGRFGI